MFGGSDEDAARAVVALADGNYLIAGEAKSADGDVAGHRGFGDAWLVKISPGGTKIWAKTFGGTSGDVAESMVATADGGVVFAGTTSSSNGDISGNHGNYDAWVAKLDGDGNLLWSKCFGGTGSEQGKKIIATLDGGLLLVGAAESSNGDAAGNHGGNDVLVVRLDAAGNKLWSRCYGGTYHDYGGAALALPDGGFVILGSTLSNDGDVTGYHGTANTTFDALLLRIDASGNRIWGKAFGGSGQDIGNELTRTNDGGLAFCGTTFSNDGDISNTHGNGDAWLVKLDATGNRAWSRVYGGSRQDGAFHLLQKSDGSFIVANAASSNDGDVAGNHQAGLADAWITGHDASGNRLWGQTFGGTSFDGCRGLLAASDGTLILAGETSSNNGDISGNHGLNDAWVMQLRTN